MIVQHHMAYVVKLNGFVKGTPFADMTVEDVIKNTAHSGIFCNAGQVCLHSFAMCKTMIGCAR